MKVQNKVLVVTGGGSGIGRELVLLLLARGARVAAVDLNPTTLEETVQIAGDIKDRLSTHVLNVTDRAGVEALPEQIIAHHGAVDGIINNAGIIQPFVKINDLQYDAIERVMNVNFYGVVYMTKSFLPHLLKRPEAHVINVSSMGGFLPVPGQSVYGAAKAAVKLFTEALNSELASTQVRVTVVFPGAVATNISSNSGLAQPKTSDTSAQESSFKPMPAPDAAKMIVDAIEKDAYQVYVGKDSQTMNTLYRLNPKNAARMIYKKMESLLSSM